MAKRGSYYSWNETSMALALQTVRKKEAGLNEASRMYGVPKATLKRRLDGGNQKSKEEVQIPGSESDLPLLLEEELQSHILQLESCLFGITAHDVRRLAFELAERNHVKHRFNKEKKIAGKKWYYGFMKRHPRLSLRQPRATSFNRATGFNRETVKQFYDNVEKAMDNHDIHDAQRIFNMDETGLSTVQKKPRKILALKGKHQVGAITSGERGTTTTAVCCASAAGNFVPPLIIFKRKRAKDELRDGAPPGSIFAFNPDSGYINKEIFLAWLQHFVANVKPTVEKKVLLILDGHTTHTKNLEAINYAKKHGVVMLSLPAHTSHKLQPLDVSFFKPLSGYFIDETERWLREHPGRCVTTFQISMLFGKAYFRAASVGTAANGFRKTGIYPFNKDAFEDYEFITVDEVEQNDIPGQVLEPSVSINVDPLETDSVRPFTHSPPLRLVTPTYSVSRSMTPTTDLTTTNNVTSKNAQTEATPGMSSLCHITDISPGAKRVVQELKKMSKKSQRSLELTGSPYKNSLEEARKQKNKPKPPQKRKDLVKPEELEKWFCKLCVKCSIEDMIQCLMCKAWVHEECACVKKGIKKYLCPSCKKLDL